MTNPIDRFTQAIETASVGEAGVFAPDAVLDATVPQLAVHRQWRRKHRGRARSLVRRPRTFRGDPPHRLPDGELVEFVLTWEEDGEPHMCHQAHVIEVHDGLITRDRAWCGGRWGASLQAEMAEAARL